MSYRISSAVVAAVTLVTASFASAAVYSSPFSPASSGTVVTSFSGSVAATPTWTRANQSTNEVNATPPTSVSSSVVSYATNTFTVPSSGTYAMYSAQGADGYLHLYANSFNPASQLTNIVAGDDDMTTLNGGTVPDRNGVPGTFDSGFSTNLTTGVTYTMVTGNWSGTGTFDYYNEVRTPPTPASPTLTIPDANPTGVTITINVPDSGPITSMNSVTLLNLLHNWAEDVDITLTHGATTVELSTDNGGSADFLGNYTFVDGGPALPTTGITPGTYGSEQLLSAFVGMDVGGDWTLRVADDASIIAGTISAFQFDVDYLVPEPTTLAALAGLGMLALRRRA